jgi:hypothetical protein
VNSDEFITSEVSVWGMDYIFELLDGGYTPIELIDENGHQRWTWMKPATVSNRERSLAY